MSSYGVWYPHLVEARIITVINWGSERLRDISKLAELCFYRGVR